MPSVGGSHVWPCPLDSLNGKLGLARVGPTDCKGIPKSLPDDVLKVRVHVGMRAQPAAKEKPQREAWVGMSPWPFKKMAWPFGGHASVGEAARSFKGRIRAEIREVSVRHPKR